jgi:uncharacterized membrane protein
MPSGGFGATELFVWELLSLAVPLLLIVLLYFLVRRAVSRDVREAITGAGSFGEAAPSAREALDRSYAGGEMKREEYLTIRDDTTRNPDA